MNYQATLAGVFNRGHPPVAFLDELVAWGRATLDPAFDAIFAPRPEPVEIFTTIRSSLGTFAGVDPSGTPIYHWDSLLHRRAALLEVIRVHAGFETSWDWNCGVDTTNAASQENRTGEETGILQVSFDSEWIADGYMKAFAAVHDIDTPEKFIPAMKANHPLALEYYARLVRENIRWAGPLIRRGDDSIYPWLSRGAVAEFETLLTA